MHTFMKEAFKKARVKEMECITKTLRFSVRRKNPELIAPAAPTPHEFKPLSDIDDQDSHRIHVPMIAIYGRSPSISISISISMQGKDPVKIIRDAIAKALVFYYPFAGRLRETATRKLLVECTAEGVLFIEADADVTAQQLPLYPPFPNLDQLLCDVPGFDGIIDCPLILFQVTRLKCGGFILGYRSNHTVGDGAGHLRFVDAISELAVGNEAPSIRPVWERHLLTARNPPCVSFPHQVYESLPLPLPVGSMEERSFFFSAGDIATLRRSLPPDSRRCSRFDLLAACIWRCRTMALYPNGSDEVRLSYAVGIGNKVNPPLPRGYYGNAVVAPTVVATVEELRNNPLQYIAELVRKARAQVTEEYVRSFMDVVVMKGRPNMMCNVEGSFVVSDLGHFRMEELDFGWGKPSYYGTAISYPESFLGMLSWFIPWSAGIIVPICLTPNAMKVFASELNTMMEFARKTTLSNASSL